MANSNKDSKTTEKETPKKKKPTFFIRFVITLLLMIGVFIVAAVITYIATYFTPVKIITTYEDCVNARGSAIQESYPSVCVTSDGKRFVQPLSEEEQKLLESPLNQDSRGSYEGQFCGGIAGVTCPQGYTCKLDGGYPDAGGKCTKNYTP
jgi:hypothetical protein